jgi:hypothetical protein
MIETCYVLEDGSVAHPRDVKRDAQGALHHIDGRAVAMRGDVPRTRSVDVEALQKAAAEKAEAAKAAASDAKRAAAETAAAKDMKPEEPKRTYKTRESKAD